MSKFLELLITILPTILPLIVQLLDKDSKEERLRAALAYQKACAAAGDGLSEFLGLSAVCLAGAKTERIQEIYGMLSTANDNCQMLAAKYQREAAGDDA